MRPLLLTALLAISIGPLSTAAIAQGTPNSLSKSAEDLRTLTEKAAKGDAGAQYNLVIMYEAGQGVPKDHAEAAKWLIKAADQGNPDAEYLLAAVYIKAKNYDEAIKWVQKAADQGNPQAQDSLGFMYAYGRVSLNDGHRVPQDYAEAVKWYRKAASQGDAGGQLGLGGAYATGQGVPQDFEEAYAWLNVAAAQGNTDAPAIRDLISQKLTPEALLRAQQLSKRYSADYVKHPPDSAP